MQNILKKIVKNTACILSAMIIFLSQAGIPVFADTIDLTKSMSLTVSIENSGEVVSNIGIAVYKVSDISASDDGNIVFDSLYGEYDYADLSTEDSITIASELAEYVEENEVSVDFKGATGTDGTVYFSMDAGVYLVVQSSGTDTYVFDPFLVSVPGQDGSSYIYQVTCSPKVGSAVTSPSTTPTNPVTPTSSTTTTTTTTTTTAKTGDDFPVWIYGAVLLSALMLMLGILIGYKSRKEEY